MDLAEAFAVYLGTAVTLLARFFAVVILLYFVFK